MEELKLSNEGRHETAARLRESREFVSSLPKTTLTQNALDTFEHILMLLDYEHGNLFDYIADLIDRPTCRNVSGCQDVFECSECRCRAELVTEVCNEYGEPFHVPLMPSFCPNCGAEVVSDED